VGWSRGSRIRSASTSTAVMVPSRSTTRSVTRPGRRATSRTRANRRCTPRTTRPRRRYPLNARSSRRRAADGVTKTRPSIAGSPRSHATARAASRRWSTADHPAAAPGGALRPGVCEALTRPGRGRGAATGVTDSSCCTGCRVASPDVAGAGSRSARSPATAVTTATATSARATATTEPVATGRRAHRPRGRACRATRPYRPDRRDVCVMPIRVPHSTLRRPASSTGRRPAQPRKPAVWPSTG
jgi:hypothetical protein